MIPFKLNKDRLGKERREVTGDVVKINTHTVWIRWGDRVIKRKIHRDLIDIQDWRELVVIGMTDIANGGLREGGTNA